MTVGNEQKSVRRWEAMPRYVILLHQMPEGAGRPTHWDLMLEDGRVLLTWALQTLPEQSSATQVHKLPDHRPAYLTYEGPVSNHRGSVRRWDQGEFQWIQRSEDLLHIRVLGQQLHGQIRLTRELESTESWQMEYFASDQAQQQQADSS